MRADNTGKTSSFHASSADKHRPRRPKSPPLTAHLLQRSHGRYNCFPKFFSSFVRIFQYQSQRCFLARSAFNTNSCHSGESTFSGFSRYALRKARSPPAPSSVPTKSDECSFALNTFRARMKKIADDSCHHRQVSCRTRLSARLQP